MEFYNGKPYNHRMERIMNEELWEKLLENIRYDIEHGDCSALYELLSFLPDRTLSRYLEDES